MDEADVYFPAMFAIDSLSIFDVREILCHTILQYDGTTVLDTFGNINMRIDRLIGI